MGFINIFKLLFTFFLAALLINLSNFDYFAPEKIHECWESNLGQLGPEAIILTIVGWDPNPGSLGSINDLFASQCLERLSNLIWTRKVVERERCPCNACMD